MLSNQFWYGFIGGALLVLAIAFLANRILVLRNRAKLTS
jgi:hypothetical protein